MSWEYEILTTRSTEERYYLFQILWMQVIIHIDYRMTVIRSDTVLCINYVCR